MINPAAGLPGHPRRRYPALAAASAVAMVVATGLAGPLHAQTSAPAKAPAAPPPPSPPPESNDQDDDASTTAPPITVTGHKPPPQPGAVVGDIKPEIQLSPADVQSYGVSTVTELLEELSPETRSDRGRGGSSPVVLLNGRRISSFNEIQNIPTEAILRVDILPEEVSLKYGYTADQRVVNIVLKRRFRAITGELEGSGATEGGDVNGQGELDQFRVRGDNRLNLDLKLTANDGLTYADRGLAANSSGPDYALGGNVVSATPGAQIDPALSALVGQPVTVAGVPANTGQPLSLADFVPTAGTPNITDAAKYRSLSAQTQALTANAVLARPLPFGINGTINATFGANHSDSMEGLPGIALQVPAGDPFSPFGSNVVVDRYVAGVGPVHQTSNGWTAHLGSTLNRDLGDWRVSLTDAYDHGDTVTDTGGGLSVSPLQSLLNGDSASFDPFGAIPASMVAGQPGATARSISNAANVQFLANGPLLKLPAGDLYVSAKVGDSESWQASSSTRFGVSQAVSLSRNDSAAQLNLDLPLASRTHHVFGAVGELSVNLNTAVDDLSDFGVLTTLGYGVNWTPIPGYNFIVSETHDHAAPSVQQLGGPVVQTPNAPIFDYLTGQSVNVTLISGGDRQLVADNRHVLKVGLTFKPIESENFTFTANYIDSRIDNAIGTLPAASAAIEAAFPDRFIRNAQGELTEEDDRPVNFAREDREELRWGINYSRPVGKQPPPPTVDWRAFARRRQAAQAQRQGPSASAPATPTVGGAAATGAAPAPGAIGAAASGPGGPPGGPPEGGWPRDGGGGGRGGGGGGGGYGGFGGGAAAGGRFQIALYHTVIFKDDIVVAPGGPTLDLLNGAAAGGAGGQYRHELEAQLGYTLNGYGMRLSADWKSATKVTSAGSSTGDLDFSEIGTINFRLFDNVGQQRPLVAKYPILRGVRVTLNVNNLFDERIGVRSASGPTPLVYQPDFLDPTGRTMSLSLRKLFY